MPTALRGTPWRPGDPKNDDTRQPPTDKRREQLANVSTDLTALTNARARVRIDAAERNPSTVGHVLGRYRTHAGLTEQELADRLGIDLPVLADLAEEIRPEKQRLLAGYSEIGLDQLAGLYGAHRERLYEAFDQGTREHREIGSASGRRLIALISGRVSMGPERTAGEPPRRRVKTGATPGCR